MSAESPEETQEIPLDSLTATHVVAAGSLIQGGKVYDLDCGRWPGMPVWGGHPPFQVLSYRTPRGVRNQADDPWPGPNDVNYGWHSEVLMATMHSGTHLDALCHCTCGGDSHWFGGATSDARLGDFGPLEHDAASIRPIVGRGVLLDVASALGVHALDAHYEITPEEISHTLERQSTELRTGDIVLIRTGYLSAWPDHERAERHRDAGINRDAALMLASAGAVILGSDTESVESLPSKIEGNPLPVHIAMLIERGVHLLEMAYLEDLAADKVYEFCFVCAPLKIRGATGSMVRPLAII